MTMTPEELADALERAPGLVMAQALGIVREVTEWTADELRRAAPARHIADSVETRYHGNQASSIGTAQPTSPLAHLFEYGTGPRFQRTTGRYTGIMAPQPFVEPVRERGAERFIRELAQVKVL